MESIWIALGDFKVVRSRSERASSRFDANEAFNDSTANVDGIFMLMWPSNATPSYISVVRLFSNPPFSVSPALVLDDTCVMTRDLGNHGNPEQDLQVRGFVAFGGNSRGGNITRKGKIRTDFKLADENHVLLKVPIKDNMYSVDLRNIVPK
ncbi:hypothetical protein Tco_0989322 [Tanacetum coccineum]|uniref:Dirigent protein n=1 Tax=Tanacetum coccineum TaxID=301880 RepID=A0ABQ5ETC1_9ASTR